MAAESSICRAQAHVQDKHRAAPDVKWKVAHPYTRNCMQWCLLSIQTDARVDQHAGCTAQYFLFGHRRQHNRCQPHLFSIVHCLHHSDGSCCSQMPCKRLSRPAKVTDCSPASTSGCAVNCARYMVFHLRSLLNSQLIFNKNQL